VCTYTVLINMSTLPLKCQLEHILYVICSLRTWDCLSPSGFGLPYSIRPWIAFLPQDGGLHISLRMGVAFLPQDGGCISPSGWGLHFSLRMWVAFLPQAFNSKISSFAVSMRSWRYTHASKMKSDLFKHFMTNVCAVCGHLTVDG